MKDIRILAIESSCDETAAAVVENGRTVLSNVISSQIELHKLYGGVVRGRSGNCIQKAHRENQPGDYPGFIGCRSGIG